MIPEDPKNDSDESWRMVGWVAAMEVISISITKDYGVVPMICGGIVGAVIGVLAWYVIESWKAR